MVGHVRFFERVAPLYDLVMPRAARRTIEAGLAVAEGPVDRVADVGGGTGRAIRELGSPTRVVVDPAERMLRRVPAGVRTIRATAGDLPFPDDVLDAVLIVDAIHHFPAVDRVLAEAFRVTRPGGVLVVIDFDPTTLRGRALVGAERLIRFESTFYPPHVLSDRMAATGFAPQMVNPGFEYVLVGRVPATA